MAVRQIPVHQSLAKPLLFAGGDRELVLLNLIGQVGVLFMQGLSVISISIFLLGGGSVHVALVVMGKKDPMMRFVWLQYGTYRSFYPARSECRVKLPKIRSGL
jgi:type IV secretory pathway TrbD component